MRVPDWPRLLARHIERRRNLPFSWGSNDCCMAAADWMLECTGADPAAHLRGTYSSARAATVLLRRYGGLAEIVTAAGLAPHRTPALAQRGDVALATRGGRELLAVVDGAYAVAPGPLGLVWVPLAEATAAWKV